MKRRFQILLIASTISLSWLLMMALHESGHVLHGWLSGAKLERVYLPPLGFSRTDFAANPHPLFVAWGGPLWGCLLPLMAIPVVRFAKNGAVAKRMFLARWLAGFCLIANGAYLLGGAFSTAGADDAGVILQHGGVRWQLVAFGLPAMTAGLCLWNGLGPHFGLKASRGDVDRKAAIAVTVVLVLVVCVEMLLPRL
ncbi:MAG: hypothetical protein LLG00_15550 [Planctomycetaceae bacterium]|nr:hypothetical protein [Planctomycetaceae bacterium]